LAEEWISEIHKIPSNHQVTTKELYEALKNCADVIQQTQSTLLEFIMNIDNTK
jgi:hypothetical protein